MADVAGGAVAVIGNGFHDHGHAAGGIAFVGDLLVIHIAQLARGLLDGAGNIVVGHIIGLGLGDNVAQLAVHIRIAAAFAHGDGNFAADLGEDLATGGVRLALLRLNVMPLGMTGHRIPPTV